MESKVWIMHAWLVILLKCRMISDKNVLCLQSCSCISISSVANSNLTSLGRLFRMWQCANTSVVLFNEHVRRIESDSGF